MVDGAAVRTTGTVGATVAFDRLIFPFAGGTLIDTVELGTVDGAVQVFVFSGCSFCSGQPLTVVDADTDDFAV